MQKLLYPSILATTVLWLWVGAQLHAQLAQQDGGNEAALLGWFLAATLQAGLLYSPLSPRTAPAKYYTVAAMVPGFLVNLVLTGDVLIGFSGWSRGAPMHFVCACVGSTAVYAWAGSALLAGANERGPSWLGPLRPRT
ncbi:MAG: hypothetical protein KDC87_16745 [Planctomycetes bacterium]|nr:hypothetical protein [Planctomycetota bacterium]MCB9871071.1 hypothetical protein [Planctomycetota bacterium]